MRAPRWARRRPALAAAALLAAAGPPPPYGGFCARGAAARRGAGPPPHRSPAEPPAASAAPSSGGSRGRPVAAPALLLSAAAALVVALAAGPQAASAEEEVAAGKGPDFFGLLFNLKEEERDIRKSEEVIQKELEKKRNSWDIFAVAKLLNEDSIMKQEIALLQREEQDINDPKKFKKDVQELIDLEYIESREQFSTQDELHNSLWRTKSWTCCRAF